MERPVELRSLPLVVLMISQQLSPTKAKAAARNGAPSRDPDVHIPVTGQGLIVRARKEQGIGLPQQTDQDARGQLNQSENRVGYVMLRVAESDDLSMTDVERTNAALRAAVIIAGKRIRHLNFGRRDDPVLAILRRTLPESQKGRPPRIKA